MLTSTIQNAHRKQVLTMSDQPEDPNPFPPLKFDEFQIPDHETWYAAATTVLKGASFEKLLTTKTYEGLVLQPIYRQEDVEQISHQETMPGIAPYVRGSRSAGYQEWHIAQETPYSSPEAFNSALRAAFTQGQTAINILLDRAAQAGLDPDLATSGDVGKDGVSIAHCDDLAVAFNGVNLETTPLMIQPGTAALPFTAILAAYLLQIDRDPAKLKGNIAFDPLGDLAQTGTLPQSLRETYDDLASLTKWTGPEFRTININTAIYHNGGASAVQELASMLATGAEYIRQMLDRGLTIQTIASHMHFTFAIGSNFFMEIAKLRTSRMVWSQVVSAFGGDEAAQKMTLHTCTGQINKTATDPYVNMLRTTIEAFAGAVSGTDSMNVSPFDAVNREPDTFSQRIARNQQLILQAECNLANLADPAGGSWYVEMLTDWLARSAWEQFQEIETAGGMSAALQNGMIQQQIGDIAKQRQINVEHRKDVLVGTNMYANIHDVPPTKMPDHTATFEERKAQIRKYREERKTQPQLAELQATSTESRLERAIAAAAQGATLGELSAALWDNKPEKPVITPLAPLRLSEPFEELREAALSFANRIGHAPKIFLANMGPLRQHKARADFTIGFFEVGGFEMLNNSGFATPADAAGAALESDAEVVVICSTDETYPDLVPPIVEQIKTVKPDMYIILAGYPKDQIAAYQASGIDDFIHIRSNCYEINRKLQQHLGVAT